MNTIKTYITLSLLLSFVFSYGQKISGKVTIPEGKGKVALPGANVYWANSTTGTFTGQNGGFELDQPASYPARLIVSFIGYQADTILFSSYRTNLKVHLKKNVELEEFEVTERQNSTIINTIDPIHIETLGAKEFKKAACCNISESFETNAAVDVAFTDAVSGSKKIQMLGLDGVYTQILFENIPLVRGLSSAYGLTFIPGTWAESIQIKKGAGSVVNGYESMTGQINIELLKPDKAEKLFVNVYGNQRGRAELNTHVAKNLNEKWSTMLFAHGSDQSMEWDNNHDGFMDMPQKRQINLFNRWKYFGKKYRTQFGVRAVMEDINSGQISSAISNENPYTIGVNTKQAEAFWKNGFLFDKDYKSIGLMSSFRYHEHNSHFGVKSYDATQNSGYVNLIYQTIIKETAHGLKMGASTVYDDYQHLFMDSAFNQTEIVPGAFTEYSYTGPKTSLVLGLRADHHNLFGSFITPRFHYKYSYKEGAAFRLSAGKGFRTANTFIENASVLANSRNVIVREKLLPEIAWNFGSSITHKFEWLNKEMGLTIDYYYTTFENQVVVDLENPREVSFYNLDGESYSHSLQLEYFIELTEQFSMKTAYKKYDIKTQYQDGLKEKPLVARDRVLFNMEYISKLETWKYDLTSHWYGMSRIPSTVENPVEHQISDQSDPYYVINGQVTKVFRTVELYAGVENILDYRQDSPIIASEDPNGPFFDASLIWGPINGRIIYGGLRFNIK